MRLSHLTLSLSIALMFGCKSEKGEAGPAGEDGAPGEAGTDGVDGEDGEDGTSGEDGVDGDHTVDDDGDGFSELDGDCDDTSAVISPQASDVVGDEIDQNCDGVDGTDMDGDGYASEASGGGDCDDFDAVIGPHFGTLDLFDGFDSNCDGLDGLALDYLSTIIDVPDTTIVDMHYVGDVNADGLDELAVETHDGFLELFSGSNISAGGTLTRSDAFITIELTMAVGGISGGDVNGDGFSDIGIGYPDYLGTGMGWTHGDQGMVIVMSGQELSSLSDAVADEGSTYVIYGNSTGSSLGVELNLTQDIDGDGLKDLIIHSNTAPADGDRQGGPYFLRANSLEPGVTDFAAGDFTGRAAGSYIPIDCWTDTNQLGSAIADLDGDGWMELSFGARYHCGTSESYNYACTRSGASFTGTLTPSRDKESPGCSYWSNGSGGQVRIGDIDGDGFDEASWSSNLYRTASWSGGAYSSTPDLVIPIKTNVHEDSPPADFDGDGINDVIIATGILFGRAEITDTSVEDVTVTVRNETIVSDFNGDGRSDIATPIDDIPGITKIYVPGMGL